ncbi:dentin sialophosphoprotein-like [Salvia hispanica]|uniref:dentin sialophosphoprotein-like n=1 Tax=Salvia hispanica TaxID=49212 RepID=UPI0020099424|nr:dentin sialophosphoprotein-like [Salvia hispanica]
MDFHSLSRRELQALCKTNKTPANVTNVAMADSLKALEIVEGVDEVLQAFKCGIYQSSVEPRSRTTRKKDLLLTPAQLGAASQRRRAAKEDSTLQQVYGTRRSARLAEKSAKLLHGITLFSTKDLFTDDVQDFKMKLEESLDGSVEVSGVTDVEEAECKDEGQVDSSDKQNVSIDVEVASIATVEDNDGHQSNLKEVEVPKIEEGHHSTKEAKIELNESRVAEIDQAGSGFETEDKKASHDESQKADGFIADIIEEEKTSEDAESVDETIVENEDLALAEVPSGTVIESVGEVFVAAQAIASEENKEDLELNTDSSETISNPDESDSDNLDIADESTESNDSMASETSLRSNEDDVSDWDEQATPGKDAAASLENSPTHQLTAFIGNAAVPSLTIQPTLFTPRRASDFANKETSDNKENENEEDLELNSTDSSETEPNPDESDSDNLDVTEESTKSNDSMAYETSLRSNEDDVSDWDEHATRGKDAAASLENSPTHQLAAFSENATVPSLTIQPTRSTPRRASDSANKATLDIKENENEEDLEFKTDSSETKSSPDESDSLNLTEESTMSDDSVASEYASESTMSDDSLTSNEEDVSDWDEQETTQKDESDSSDLTAESTKSNDSLASKISLMSNEDDVINWDELVTPEKDAAASLDHSPTPSMENAAVLSLTIPPTLSTPGRPSASKAIMRTDNKENIGSGSKSAPAKERSKIVKKIAESVPMLDDLKGENEASAAARTALQALSENQKAN